MIEKYNENIDAEDRLWAYETILDHRRKKGKIEVLIKWTTGEETWEPLSMIKRTDPLHAAKYAHENELTSEKGWKWAKNKHASIERYIQKLSGIQSSVTENFMRTIYKVKRKKNKPKGIRYKFGVELPRNTKHALELDRNNGNTLWKEAMESETKGLMEFETFIVLGDDERPPKGYSFIPLHACYECKVDGRRKCRIVANGGLAPEPDDSDLYSGVVTIDVVQLLILIGMLNDLQIMATDISQAYLHGITREKLYTRAGPEFCPELEGN